MNRSYIKSIHLTAINVRKEVQATQIQQGFRREEVCVVGQEVAIHQSNPLDPNSTIPHLIVNPSANTICLFIPDLFE
jgi:hypothetical protein